MSQVLWHLLKPQRLTEVVDIGANPIDGDPPYKAMLAAGQCRVTGFEPQAKALAALQKTKGENERYLPYAIGDGKEHALNVCRARGMTSLLEPDPAALALFDVLRPLGEVIRKVPIATRRLDEVDEIAHLDFLKIDVQAQGGPVKLSRAVVIQVEVSFITLYKDQPSVGEIDLELRRQGFVPHCFAGVKRWPISPYVALGNRRRAIHQLLEADIVYARDFSRPESMSDEQLKHLALIAHHCYGSIDLALRCVMLLEKRQVLENGAQRCYLESAQGKSHRDTPKPADAV